MCRQSVQCKLSARLAVAAANQSHGAEMDDLA